jgi:predicted outer membrane lipoprotein
MSYCVNCGVELADSEKRCPLCDLEVQNPRAPWTEPDERPYPRHVDKVLKRIDRRYFATLSGLLLTIPCLITMLLDLISGGRLSWSAYVIGAVALVYVSVLLPLYFKKYHTVIFLAANCCALLLYLLFIERANGGSWFLRLGLPLTVAFSVCLIALALLFTETRFSLLVKAGSVLITTGLFIVCIELVTRRYIYEDLRIVWSFYALIPCLVLGVAAMVLEHRKNLKERIRRRLFY